MMVTQTLLYFTSIGLGMGISACFQLKSTVYVLMLFWWARGWGEVSLILVANSSGQRPFILTKAEIG